MHNKYTDILNSEWRSGDRSIRFSTETRAAMRQLYEILWKTVSSMLVHATTENARSQRLKKSKSRSPRHRNDLQWNMWCYSLMKTTTPSQNVVTSMQTISESRNGTAPTRADSGKSEYTIGTECAPDSGIFNHAVDLFEQWSYVTQTPCWIHNPSISSIKYGLQTMAAVEIPARYALQ